MKLYFDLTENTVEGALDDCYDGIEKLAALLGRPLLPDERDLFNQTVDALGGVREYVYSVGEAMEDYREEVTALRAALKAKEGR